MPKTKIIATLGPASSSETVIRKMVLAGMDVARLNFSHGDIYSHQKRLDTVRRINQKYHRRIRILQDLEGNRIRIGKLKDGKSVLLKKRQRLMLLKKELIGNQDEVYFDYEGSFSDIKSGMDIFIDDGNIRLEAKKIFRTKILAEVIEGLKWAYQTKNDVMKKLTEGLAQKFKGMADGAIKRFVGGGQG